MRRILVAVLGLAATLTVGPTAHAANPDHLSGGCFFNTDEQATLTGGANVGVIGDHSITSTGDVPQTPIGATVTCWITVNGITAPGTTHSYGDIGGVPGVQAGSDPISFVSADSDYVDVCESVAFADNTSVTYCPFPLPDQNLPPGWVTNTIETVIDAYDNLFVSDVDPVVCPVLADLAGNYADAVVVDPTGDVAVVDPLGLGLNPVYDCPPYVRAS